jgi:hypothetical protein
MKKQTRGFASLTLAILLTAIGWNLAGNFEAQAATNLVVNAETKLEANDAGPTVTFGVDVAINANTAAVGALNVTHGAVYIFTLTGTNWARTQVLTAGVPAAQFESFGSAVALSSNVLVVGQPLNYQTNLTGEVYVFTNSGTTWSFQQRLGEVGSPVPGSGFGSAVDVSGKTLVAGNPLESSGTPNSGAVYVYQEIGTNWLLQAKLKANDATNNASLGGSVAIDGNTILAGANDAAYVFVRNGTNWTQQKKLTDPVLPVGGGFGGSVALEGNVAVVTARKAASNSNSGAVYVFVRTGTNWVFRQELVLGNDESNSVFGASVAIYNGAIVVGLPTETVDGILAAGAVDLFQFNGTSWVLTQEVAATDANSGAALGATVDFAGAGIIAGAPFDFEVGRSSTGAAYIFSVRTTTPPVVPIASASPNVLFPPNHKLVPVTISVANHASFTSCKIVSVSSNEPIAGKGNSKKSQDWIITGDLTLLLRAERTGNNKAGRIYTIEVACTDLAGNPVSTTVLVTVPHDNGKK